MGVVYMSTGMTHVLVLYLSGSVLGEKLTPDHAISVALIVTGVATYGS